METDAALVRTDGVVVLYAVAHIGLHVALVVYPCHTERNDAVGYAKTLYKVCTVELGVTVVLFFNSAEYLAHCLNVFRLVWEALFQTLYSF